MFLSVFNLVSHREMLHILDNLPDKFLYSNVYNVKHRLKSQNHQVTFEFARNCTKFSKSNTELIYILYPWPKKKEKKVPFKSLKTGGKYLWAMLHMQLYYTCIHIDIF